MNFTEKFGFHIGSSISYNSVGTALPIWCHCTSDIFCYHCMWCYLISMCICMWVGFASIKFATYQKCTPSYSLLLPHPRKKLISLPREKLRLFPDCGRKRRHRVSQVGRGSYHFVRQGRCIKVHHSWRWWSEPIAITHVQ